MDQGSADWSPKELHVRHRKRSKVKVDDEKRDVYRELRRLLLPRRHLRFPLKTLPAHNLTSEKRLLSI